MLLLLHTNLIFDFAFNYFRYLHNCSCKLLLTLIVCVSKQAKSQNDYNLYIYSTKNNNEYFIWNIAIKTHTHTQLVSVRSGLNDAKARNLLICSQTNQTRLFFNLQQSKKYVYTLDRIWIWFVVFPISDITLIRTRFICYPKKEP